MLGYAGLLKIGDDGKFIMMIDTYHKTNIVTQEKKLSFDVWVVLKIFVNDRKLTKWKKNCVA